MTAITISPIIRNKISLDPFPTPILVSPLHLNISKELLILIISNSILSIFSSTQSNQEFTPIIASLKLILQRTLTTVILLNTVINPWSLIDLSASLDTIDYSDLFGKLPPPSSRPPFFLLFLLFLFRLPQGPFPFSLFFFLQSLLFSLFFLLSSSSLVSFLCLNACDPVPYPTSHLPFRSTPEAVALRSCNFKPLPTLLENVSVPK